MITITQLEYIVAVDTYRHFGNAAEKCLVTQPTLSMQIKKFEDFLGVKIFDRSKQPVIPTDVGALIIHQARNILHETLYLKSIAKSYYKNISGRLNIGIIPTLAPYLLPLFIGNMMRVHKGIKLNIRELSTAEIIEELKKDQLDVGILSTPLHESSIFESPIFYEEIKIYTHYNHPLGKKINITPQDIADRQDMWMLTDGNCFKNHVINFCDLRPDFPDNEQIRYESGSLETLKKIVETEGGFTFIPELASLELSTKHLDQILSFEAPIPLREVSLCYVRNHSKKEMINILQSSIEEVVPVELLDKDRGRIVEWK